MKIEETIQQVENLYERLTGQQVPQGEIKYPMTSNIDPLLLIETRFQELMQRIQDPQIQQRLEPWTPALSVWESEESIFVRADLPQVKKEDIDISFRGNVLMIAGIRRNLQTTDAMIPKMNETVFGPFYRAVVLPYPALSSNVQSNLVDGVLEITLAKTTAKEEGSKAKASKKVQ